MCIAYALLFQILIVLSLEADASKVPVGLTATSYTDPLCPKNFEGLEFGVKPHVMIVPSVDDDTTCLKLGLNTT